MSGRGWVAAIVVTAALVGAAPAARAYDARRQRDPFVPLVAPDGTVRESANRPTQPVGLTGPLQVQGIVYDPTGRSIAVINGEVMEAGERRETVEVVAIAPSSVTVRQGGVEQVLPFEGSAPEPEDSAS